MFCPKCGNQLPDNATACENCGHELKGADVAARTAAPTQKGIGTVAAQGSSKVKIGIGVAAIVVIVLLIVVGARGCSGGSSSSTGHQETTVGTPVSGDIYEDLTDHYWKDASKDANIIFLTDGKYVLRIDDGTYGKYQGTWEKSDGGITLVQTSATEKTSSGKVSTDKSEHRYSITITGTGKNRVLTCSSLGLTLRW